MNRPVPEGALSLSVQPVLTVGMCMTLVNVLQRQLIVPGVVWGPIHDALIVAVEHAVSPAPAPLPDV